MSESDMEIVATPSKTPLTKEERQARRLKRSQKKDKMKKGALSASKRSKAEERDKLVSFLSKNQGDLLDFVVNVNKLYEEKLKKPAPFMTFVLVGMQSSGKSTFMERLLSAVLNIVQEGTGTRCPLDVTCIYDSKYKEPRADLSGEELEAEGNDLPVDAVFARIVNHNKLLANEDRFSTKSLKLVYRANNVQNMRFVDTPGIITNKSKCKDNREDIKSILRTEIAKPNTKLCVLLEATEYDKNPIVNILDESLGGRKGWISNATFLMTKFDKQMHDSRSAIKANGFFSKFLEEQIIPHLVITPTLENEDLPPDQLFKKRNELLADSNDYEREMFQNWLKQHKAYRALESSDVYLDERILSLYGFPRAQATMRKEMLEHTLATLPTVIGSLQKELAERQAELEDLEEKQKFTSPAELKVVVKDMLHNIQERVGAYLDGDLLSSLKYNDKLQTLEDEVFEEEEDEVWATRSLNFHKEDMWRTHIAEMEEHPDEVQADKRFLGGKQVQRAIEFFRCVMIDSLPNPYELKELVPNAAGYGGGGLMRENWEGATKQICMVLMQDVTHPGINYLVKHIGYILRRLFHIALEDIKEGQEFSKTFRLIPDAVENYLIAEFDKMLWSLMQKAANNIHMSLEPLYATIDPNLPTFQPVDKNEEEKQGEAPPSFFQRVSAAISGSGSEAKALLKRENKERAQNKKAFLRDERTAMITEEETVEILQRSFQYLVALMNFSLVWFRLQVNHFLYESFKSEMKKSFLHKASEAKWEDLVQPDPTVTDRIKELKDQIQGLESSLQEVHRMNQRI